MNNIFPYHHVTDDEITKDNLESEILETVDIPNICEILNNEVNTLDANKYFDQNIDPDVFQEINSICRYYTEHKIN